MILNVLLFIAILMLAIAMMGLLYLYFMKDSYYKYENTLDVLFRTLLLGLIICIVYSFIKFFINN